MHERIKVVMAQIFNIEVDSITEQSSPENVERWDSLRHMQLILALEDEFGVTIADEAIPDLLSINAIEEGLRESGG